MGLRKRIVNFSSTVEESASAEAAPKGLIPDVVRSSRNGLESVGAGDERISTSSNGASDGVRVPSRKPVRRTAESSEETDEEGDDGETAEVRPMLESSNTVMNNSAQFTEGTTSATEWIGITTNDSEEENSYTSELDASDSQNECSDYAGVCDFAPTVILNPCCGTNDRSKSAVVSLRLNDY